MSARQLAFGVAAVALLAVVFAYLFALLWLTMTVGINPGWAHGWRRRDVRAAKAVLASAPVLVGAFLVWAIGTKVQP